MQPISPRHQTAREYAAAGIPVFPCVVNGKFPLPGSKGFQDATTDLAVIDAWWSEADYNVAVEPDKAGWLVVDGDVYKGADLTPFPETYEVKTPRGGRHLYYEGSAASSVEKLGVGIDTRGVGGYVLLPPSVVNGAPYEIVHQRDMAPLPEWVKTKLHTATKIEVASDIQDDTPANIERAIRALEAHVKAGRVAVEGRGGNTHTYKIACEVRDMAISLDKAIELIEEHFNPHCVPPWEHEELCAVVGNAFNYAQNDAGAYAVVPAAEAFRTALDQLAITPAPGQRSRFHAEDEDEQEDGEDPKWLLPELIPDAGLVLVQGKTQSFKSFIALDWVLAVASGVPTMGIKPERSGPVFYAALEGRAGIKKARRRAWKMARGVDKLSDFYVMPGPLMSQPADVQEFGDEIRRRAGDRRVGAIVIDTVSNSMVGWNENDAADVAQYTHVAKTLSDFFRCPVILIHHKGKDEGRGARGSGAWRADVDTVIDVHPYHDENGRPINTAVKVTVLKQKDADEREEPIYLEGKVVGPSLAFQEISAQAYAIMTKPEDRFERRKVGAALQKLGAVGADHAVTTAVLAVEMTPTGEGDAVEAISEAQKKTEQTLRRLARDKLELYCSGSGLSLCWHLPPAV